MDERQHVTGKLSLPRAMATLFYVAIIVALTMLFTFILLVPAVSIFPVSAECRGDCADADAIKIALSLGRLDIISLCLAFLGLVVAFFAIFGFLAVREKAVLEARDAGRVESSRLFEQEYRERFAIYDKTLPDMIESILEEKLDQKLKKPGREVSVKPSEVPTGDRKPENGSEDDDNFT